METQNPPAIEWMSLNLPMYFTDDIAMMACYFCPMRIHPEYVMKQLKEHFGPQVKPLYRTGRVIHRMNGSPKLERKSDGSANGFPIINFNIPSTDTTARKAVYSMDMAVRDTNPSDSQIKIVMRQWYDKMVAQYYGNVTALPEHKPEGGIPRP